MPPLIVCLSLFVAALQPGKHPRRQGRAVPPQGLGKLCRRALWLLAVRLQGSAIAAVLRRGLALTVLRPPRTTLDSSPDAIAAGLLGMNWGALSQASTHRFHCISEHDDAGVCSDESCTGVMKFIRKIYLIYNTVTNDT